MERVQAIFCDVFDDPDLAIELTTTATDVEDWDSLNQINLVVAMEQEFSLRLALDEIHEFKNVGDMIGLIDRKLEERCG